MKKIIFILSVITLFGCESTSNDEIQDVESSSFVSDYDKDTDYSTFSDNRQFPALKEIEGGVTIMCSGSCDCRTTNVGAPDNAITCTCSDCSMDIIFDLALNVNANVVQIEEELNALDFFKDEFDAFTLDKHGVNNINTYNKLELQFFETGYSVLYFYEFESEEHTVMMTYNRMFGDPKSFCVDCDGSCNCKEQYVFSNPPRAECSCTPCSMTVTQNTIRDYSLVEY